MDPAGTAPIAHGFEGPDQSLCVGAAASAAEPQVTHESGKYFIHSRSSIYEVRAQKEGINSRIFEVIKLTHDAHPQSYLIKGAKGSHDLISKGYFAFLSSLIGNTHTQISDHFSINDGSEYRGSYFVMKPVGRDSLVDVLQKTGALGTPSGFLRYHGVSLVEASNYLKQGLSCLKAQAGKMVHLGISPRRLRRGLDSLYLVGYSNSRRLNDLERAHYEKRSLNACSSPELHFAMPITSQADLFSLGATLFRMITGKDCFEGVDAETRVKKMAYSLRVDEAYITQLTALRQEHETKIAEWQEAFNAFEADSVERRGPSRAAFRYFSNEEQRLLIQIESAQSAIRRIDAFLEAYNEKGSLSEEVLKEYDLGEQITQAFMRGQEAGLYVDVKDINVLAEEMRAVILSLLALRGEDRPSLEDLSSHHLVITTWDPKELEDQELLKLFDD